MPWRETCRMDQRSEFIDLVRSKQMTFKAACEQFGITRQSGYKWWNRWKRDRSVDEESRRPHSHPATTRAALVKKIVSQRKQFPLWGPVPIRKRLQDLWPEIRWPAVSTIG